MLGVCVWFSFRLLKLFNFRLVVGLVFLVWLVFCVWVLDMRVVVVMFVIRFSFYWVDWVWEMRWKGMVS